MSFLDSDRSVERKLREAFLAPWIELRFDKDEILARHLNRIYLGSGVIGMSGAARHYFGKDVQDLTAAYASVRAGQMPVEPWATLRALDEQRLRLLQHTGGAAAD